MLATVIVLPLSVVLLAPAAVIGTVVDALVVPGVPDGVLPATVVLLPVVPLVPEEEETKLSVEAPVVV